MNEDNMKQPGPQAGTLQPWAVIEQHARLLDKALHTIDDLSSEAQQARTFIVAQIIALRWAAKQCRGE